MNEHVPQSDGQRPVEIGLDGKPFEVWQPSPQLSLPGPTHSADDWVGGSYNPRGPAETAMLEIPRNSMEMNHFAWYSLGLGGFALIGALLGWIFNGAGMPFYVDLGFAGVGAYFGMRSHNAGIRGFCTNGGLGMAGIVVSIVAALGIVGVLARGFMAVATIATTGTS